MGVNLSSIESAQAIVETKLPLIKYQIVTNAVPSTSRNPPVNLSIFLKVQL